MCFGCINVCDGDRLPSVGGWGNVGHLRVILRAEGEEGSSTSCPMLCFMPVLYVLYLIGLYSNSCLLCFSLSVS